MADQFFEELWNVAIKEINDVYANDKKFLKTKVYPEREKAMNILQTNYIKYVSIINKLGECYSQIIQPQERKLIRTLLDSCTGRLIEIKHEIVSFENTDFVYLDNILLQMKKSILDLEIVVPEYYRTERIEKLEHVEMLIQHGLQEKAEEEAHKLLEELAAGTEEESRNEGDETNIEEVNTEQVDSEEADTPSTRGSKMIRRATADQIATRPKFKVVEITEEEKALKAAVSLIQRHERARVGRLKTQVLMEELRLKEDIAWLRHKPIPEDVKLKVAKIIKRYWARYKERRHQTYISIKRNIVMGLLEPSWKSGNELKMAVDELGANRRNAQEEALAAMEDAAVVARLRLEKNSEKICESITDELRYFIYTWYKAMEAAKNPMLPEWPDATPIIPGPFVYGVPKDAPDGLAEKMVRNVVNTLSGRIPEPIGGSALITAGHWIPLEVYILLIDQIQRAKKGAKTEKKKPTKEELKEKLKKEKELAAKRLADLKKEGFVPTASKFTDYLDASVQDYHVDWKTRDVTRKHNQNLIDLEVAKVLHLELRAQVDNNMRLELDRLQNAINLQRGLPPFVRKEPKPKKPKKGKKDPTKEKTEDELLKDMAGKGLITPYKRLFFLDLPGDHSLTNYEARNIFYEDPSPHWGDFKQVVKEFCVLHLGSNFIHEKAPLVRSVLICGPQQIIEDYADVICTESGAVRFTLDPLKKPLNSYKKNMFNHLFIKVPRLVKPSVIFIPGAEKMFYKKVPKDEREFNPKKLGKIVPKLVKSIKPGDQILILGISDQPWVAAANQMTKTFDKVICFPDCDSQSLERFWSERLFKYHGVNRYFNVPVLTNMTKGYDLKELDDKLTDLMKPERIAALKFKPLLESELCLNLPPLVTGKQQINSWEWSQKNVKMYIQRKNNLLLEAEKRAKLEKGGNKQPAKNKGKMKEIKEKQMIDNNLLSRALNRPVTACGPWAPKKEKESTKYYFNLKFDSTEIPLKKDLYRNEKSLTQFPIRKPSI